MASRELPSRGLFERITQAIKIKNLGCGSHHPLRKDFVNLSWQRQSHCLSSYHTRHSNSAQRSLLASTPCLLQFYYWIGKVAERNKLLFAWRWMNGWR
jgi:hypothetical protein